jgi:ferredoxin-type protein NapH
MAGVAICARSALSTAWLARPRCLRVRFDTNTCTHCGECAKVCPEPQVLNLKKLDERGYVFSGECSNCGRCSPICPEGSLKFDFKPLIRSHNTQDRAHADAIAVQRRTR